MSESIEFTQLMARASAHGGDLKLAETLRTAYLDRNPDDAATTAGDDGDPIAITSGGRPMTVSQVEAELHVLILGE